MLREATLEELLSGTSACAAVWLGILGIGQDGVGRSGHRSPEDQTWLQLSPDPPSLLTESLLLHVPRGGEG